MQEDSPSLWNLTQNLLGGWLCRGEPAALFRTVREDCIITINIISQILS